MIKMMMMLMMVVMTNELHGDSRFGVGGSYNQQWIIIVQQ